MNIVRTKLGKILIGDCLKVLPTLLLKSVHMCVTSPPYFNLRDYETGSWIGGDESCDHVKSKGQVTRGSSTLRGGTLYDGEKMLEITTKYKYVCKTCGARRVDDQIGQEETPDQYIAKMVEVFRGVRNCLRDDGILFLNIGDSYSGGKVGRDDQERLTSGAAGGHAGGTVNAHPQYGRNRPPVDGIPSGNLLGIPWRVAFALQADGWILRQDIIWHKPNPMPESVTTRCTKSHEYVFLFAKSQKYYYDNVAIFDRTEGSWNPRSMGQRPGAKMTDLYNSGGSQIIGAPTKHEDEERQDRNRRSVWTIPTKPFKGAHFACYPPDLVKPCVLAGTSAYGVCPQCSSPWKRLLERDRKPTRPARDSKIGDRDSSVVGNRDPERHVTSIKTIGWEPTCKCGKELEPVPATVLDPFFGAGTTGVATIHQGRRYLGIELGEGYAAMAHKRLRKAENALGFALHYWKQFRKLS